MMLLRNNLNILVHRIHNGTFCRTIWGGGGEFYWIRPVFASRARQPNAGVCFLLNFHLYE